MTRLLKTLTLGLALLSVSCSKSTDAPLNQETQATQTTKLSLSMEAELDTDELRNAMKVQFSTDNAFRLILPRLQEGDVVPIKLAFSNGTTLDHHDVNFTYNNGKLRYSGQIAVTAYGASSSVTNSQWYVMAFFGGRRIANNYEYTPQLLNLSRLVGQDVQLGYPGRINVPFVSRWTPVTRTGQNSGQFSVSLKPLGHFLRLQVENQRDHAIRIQGFEVEGDDYWSAVSFRPDHTLPALQRGDFPAFTRLAANDIHYTGGHTVEKGTPTALKSEVYFLWVIPKEETTEDKSIKLNVVHYDRGGKWRFPFSVKVPAGANGFGGNQSLKTLKIKNDHKIYRPLHTIDYLAFGNIDAQGNELAEGENGANFRFPDYRNLVLPNPETRKMTAKDWLDILPRSNAETIGWTGGRASDGTIFYGPSMTTTVTNEYKNAVPAGAASYETTSRYVSNAPQIVYAIRSVDGVKQAAYRYTFPSSLGNIIVEMVHLDKDGVFEATLPGQTYDPNIDEIKTDAYWERAYKYGEVVKRLLPKAGRIQDYMSGDSEYLKMHLTGRIGHAIPETETDGNVKKVRLMYTTPRDLRVNN